MRYYQVYKSEYVDNKERMLQELAMLAKSLRGTPATLLVLGRSEGSAKWLLQDFKELVKDYSDETETSLQIGLCVIRFESAKKCIRGINPRNTFVDSSVESWDLLQRLDDLR